MRFKIIANISNLRVDDIIDPEKTTTTDYLINDAQVRELRDVSQEMAIDAMLRHYPELDRATTIKKIDTYSFKRKIMKPEALLKVADLVGYRKPSGRVQTLSPGDMSLMHMDDLGNNSYMHKKEKHMSDVDFDDYDREQYEKDKRYLGRMFIMLEDSVDGQGIFFADEVMHKWKAGDVVYWDWVDTWHSTFNTSFWERNIIRLTGIVTDKTKELINSPTIVQLEYEP